MQEMVAASIIFAAGYGSRMGGFSGNKTLLPLRPGSIPFEGEYPIILEVIRNLPRGPKALVIHHRKDEVIAVTCNLGVSYYEQPVLNGTGGALIAAEDFLDQTGQEHLIITMDKNNHLHVHGPVKNQQLMLMFIQAIAEQSGIDIESE